MSDESNKLFTVELTEDEIDQCTHAINELCEVFVKDGHSLQEPEIQSYLNTVRKLDSVFSQPTANTDRFAMGTPGVAHAGENIASDVEHKPSKMDVQGCRLDGFGENREVKPSTGQTWTHKQKGYDVEITYINRRGGGIRVEEVATGQPDGFGIEVFLERFSPKNKDSDS